MAQKKHTLAGGHNHLLDALPAQERASLIDKSERISLGTKQLLYEINEPIREAYFLLSGVASMISILDEGTLLEVGTIGNEGVVGVPLFLGADRIPFRSFCQVPGEAFKVKAEVLQQEMEQSRALQAVVQRYLQALFTQLAQSVACNRLHSIEQRFARWMLTTCDRVDSDEFPMAQEFMAMMLGAQQASVSQVAVAMQAAGMIEYSRGVIKIRNARRLETQACECYRIIKDEYDRFFNSHRRERGG